MFNAIGGESYRGEHLGDLILALAETPPDIHRELHRVNVLGDVVAVELSIQGTFTGPFPTPAGVIQPTGVGLDIPWTSPRPFVTTDRNSSGRWTTCR